MATTGATPTRRSRRERKSNTRYNDQVEWNEETLRLLRADSDSSDRSSKSPTPDNVQRQTDPDVNDVVMHDADDMDREQSRASGMSDGTASPSIATPDEEDADIDRDASEIAGRLSYTPMIGQGSRPRPKLKGDAQTKGLRNRMLQEDQEQSTSFHKMARERWYQKCFGPELEDLYPIIRARDVWHLYSRDAVLPSRMSMKEAMRLEAEGHYLQPKESLTSPQHDTNHSSMLLPDLLAGREKSESPQNSRALSKEEALAKKYLDPGVLNEVVLGPWDHSQKHKLNSEAPVNVAQVWPSKNDRANDSPPNPTDSPPASNITAYHRGWVLNLGATPQCFAWAPSKSDSQYLAVSVKCSVAQRQTAIPPPSKFAPAFSSSSAYPSHISVWRIRSSSGNEDEPARFSHSSDHAPQLHQTLCMSWGNITKFQWLPRAPQEDAESVRSIAVLSSDGSVRILEVDLDASGYIELDKGRLNAHSPDHTIFSSFCLPSHEDLIVGGADGSVYLYNLNASDETGNMTPYLTIPIHSTYIMDLSVASDYPYYLATTSAAGDLILTDLRCPFQDRVRVRKSRLPNRNLCYLPHIRTFLTMHDASGQAEPSGTSLSTVVGHSLRHFYHTITFAKLPEQSGVMTTLASSSFHPIVLMANASGSVFASNVVRKALPTGLKDNGGGAFLAKLYEVDWIPLPLQNPKAMPVTDVSRQESSIGDHSTEAIMASEKANRGAKGHAMTRSNEREIQDTAPESLQNPLMGEASNINLYHGKETRSGIIRFHEGFRPQMIETNTFGRASAARTNIDMKDRHGEKLTAASFQTIWHEEQAVTAMAWNDNPRFGTWAAIGWGGGVVRIVDLGHDAV